MQVGRSIPRYRHLDSYLLSELLQTAFVEYHILVVQVCHKIYQESRSHRIPLFSKLDGGTLFKFRTELDRWAVVIRNEVTVLAQKERQKRFRHVNDYLQSNRLRLRLSDSCSKFDTRNPGKRSESRAAQTCSNALPISLPGEMDLCRPLWYTWAFLDLENLLCLLT